MRWMLFMLYCMLERDACCSFFPLQYCASQGENFSYRMIGQRYEQSQQ